MANRQLARVGWRRQRLQAPPTAPRSRGALVADREHQPAGAREQGNQRRSRVVGIFPNDAAIARFVAALLIEQTEEWHITRCYMSQESPANMATPETKLMVHGGQAA